MLRSIVIGKKLGAGHLKACASRRLACKGSHASEGKKAKATSNGCAGDVKKKSQAEEPDRWVESRT